MPSRREVLKSAVTVGTSLALGSLAKAWEGDKLVTPSEIELLRGMAKATVASATVAASDPRNRCGHALVTPGGNYPAFWVRDFSMALGLGLVDDLTVRRHLRLVAQTQNGPDERRLTSGAIVPPYAIADHIDLDGQAVFYPGTYSSGDDQGGEPWGVLPPIDDHYEFVHIAHELWRSSGSSAFLDERVREMSVFERLARAFHAPEVDPETGLCRTTTERRAVGFGFCDSVFMTGSLLFASLLQYRAMGELTAMAGASGRAKEVSALESGRRTLARSVSEVFATDLGWLRAATATSGQLDVWGTLFALHLGLLGGRLRSRAEEAVVESVKDGSVTFVGAVRHVPLGHDFSATTAWERTAGVPVGRYQNGAYWHVAAGWLVEALARADRKLARKVVEDTMAHFRAEDFRSGEKKGAPWECLSPDGYRQNPVYMASVTLPLRSFERVR